MNHAICFMNRCCVYCTLPNHWTLNEVHYDSEWFVAEIRRISIKPKRFRSKHHNSPRPLNTGDNGSQLYFTKAQDLMENLIGSNDDLEFQVVSEISKGLLWKALECEDSKTNTIVSATLAYMAALNFAASEYQIVRDLCSRVIMNEKPKKEDKEILNAGCLLYIEDISIIIGFYLIIGKTNYSLYYTKRHFFLDLRLSPEVFAYYLTISSIERKARAYGINQICQTPTFPLDAILITITNRKFSRIPTRKGRVLRVYQRTDALNSLEVLNGSRLKNKDDIIQLLKEFSLQNLMLFYNAICKDFDIQCSTVDCYRAAYLYQRRKYPEILDLCERILNKPDLQCDLKEFAFANVIVLPPISLFFRQRHPMFAWISHTCSRIYRLRMKIWRKLKLVKYRRSRTFLTERFSPTVFHFS